MIESTCLTITDKKRAIREAVVVVGREGRPVSGAVSPLIQDAPAARK